MKRIAFMLLLFTFAQAKDKVDESGFAAFVGYGERFGGLGVEVEYQIKKINGLLTITPFVSCGRYLSPLEDYLGYSIGCNAEIGHNHRGILGFLYGTIDEEYEKTQELFSGAKYYEGNNLIVGPALIVGYKGMASFGLSWTVSTGYGFHLNAKDDFFSNLFKETDKVSSLMFSAGIGFKI